MTTVLVFIALLLVFGYFRNAERLKEQDESFDKFVDDLHTGVVDELDKAIAKAEQIAEENGVDLHERFSKD